MNMTTLQLIPAEELQALKSELSAIKKLLEQRPDDLFMHRWIESKKVPPLLGISSRTWQTWRDQRIIPFSQFGSKIYVNLNDLNTLLESHKIETPKNV